MKYVESKVFTLSQQITLQLAYIIHKAKWNAAYDCRVDSKTNSMQLIYYGNIQQSTGEDWKDVTNPSQ